MTSSDGGNGPGGSKHTFDAATWGRVDVVLDELWGGDAEPTLEDARRLCGDDDLLLGHVARLLEQDGRSGGLLDAPVETLADVLLADEGEGLPTPAAIQEDLSGRRFGPYEVRRTIGSGGMGAVYEAFDPRLDRSVALKLLPRAWSQDPRLKERFLREARAASALDHPNICTIHDLGESDDGRLFIVMAYYPGETLKQRLQKGPLPPEEARRIVRRLASGLHCAHQAGVVHRDIKPANVILTEGGDVKIVDFGIATIAGGATLTRSGMSPGTPAYMSPEQIRGETAGPASDVWSLGVVLYEMLAGQRPFRSDMPSTLIYQILEQPVPDLGDRPAERPETPEPPEDLVRVVNVALAKDPEGRFANCEALIEVLDGTTTEWPTPAIEDRRKSLPWRALGFGLAAVSLTLLAALWLPNLRTSSSRTGDAASVAPEEVAPEEAVGAALREPTLLAVLPFDNVSQNAELDWLRQGVTDMLITDLSQSSDIAMLSGRRLRQALKEMGVPEAGFDGLSTSQLQTLGDATEVAAVVQGSYVQLGETLRVTFTLEAVDDGTILGGESFEGQDADALFELVDRMTSSIRRLYELVPSAADDLRIQDVTTDSVEAWRYFTEGVQLARAGKRSEAVVMFEQSLRSDADFALASAVLGQTLTALGRVVEGRQATQHAVDLADRLPLHERFVIEARHYTTRWGTYHRAMAAYEQGLELFPQRQPWRANLARLYAYVERYEDAAAAFAEVIDGGSTHTGNFTEGANVLAGLGRFDEGHETLERFARRFPDRWLIHLGLGWHTTEWGRFEDAHGAFDRAAELRPGEMFVAYGRWRLAVLEEDWLEAEARATKMAGFDDPLSRWLAAVAASRNALHRGDVEAGLEALGRAAARLPRDSFTAQAHVWRAAVLLHQGKAREALEAAGQAQAEGNGDWPQLEGLMMASLASEALGDSEGADQRLEALRTQHDDHPNRVEARQLHHLSGRLHLQRGELDEARHHLEAAESLLPPRGVEFVWFVYPDHVPIWYALGQLEEAAGKSAAALDWYTRCATVGSERLERPLASQGCRARWAELEVEARP